jgi:hypothetical protein
MEREREKEEMEEVTKKTASEEGTNSEKKKK